MTIETLRQEAQTQFKSLGYPNQKMEGWRYMDLAPLTGTRFVVPQARTMDVREILRFRVAHDEERLTFVNGYFSRDLSMVRALPAGVALQNLADAMLGAQKEIVQRYLASHLKEEANAFAALNTSHFRQGAFLYLPDKAVMDKPVHILFLNTNEQEAPVVYPRILIVAGESARVKVTVTHRSLGLARFFKNSVTEAYLGPGACLDYSEFSRGSEGVLNHTANRFYLKKHAALNLLSFLQGASASREETLVEFEEEHAFASLTGLSVLQGNSQAFRHVTVNHRVGHCTSRQFFKNILTGKSKSEFNSLVFVHKDAQKSDSKQLNKNLLLSEFAQVFTRPQLKIEADDVSATHGATVGQLDENELFYLRSRGIKKEEAQLILTHGFAEEIIELAESPTLKKEWDELVKKELSNVDRGRVSSP